jgi:hypothetical protein
MLDLVKEWGRMKVTKKNARPQACKERTGWGCVVIKIDGME